MEITEKYIDISSKGAARWLEQLMIDAAGGIGKLENKINGIRANNPNI